MSSFIIFLEKYKINDVDLVITGEPGWQYDTLFQDIKNFDKFKEHIIFTGFIEDKDMAALYSGSIVFAYMSLYEGFGLPILEAMQCGVPVIASNNSSIPEVVGDAGIMISASHNPYYDNGIKIFSQDGFKLPDEMEHRIEELILSNHLHSLRPTETAIGKAHRIDDAVGRYVVFLKNTFPGKVFFGNSGAEANEGAI